MLPGKGKGKKSSSKVSPAVNQTLTTNTFILGENIDKIEEEDGQENQLIIYGERHNSYISNTSSTDNSGGSSVGV